MSLDHYVTLGQSGLRVSPFCLGAMTFGDDLGWGASVDTSQRLLDHFFERGGNFVDTANAYTKGHSEKIIGDHIGRHSHKRARAVLATKFFGNLFPGDPNGGGAGRKALLQQLDESLRRLQTDYIDLYWMHCWDTHTPIEETMRALDDAVRAGKVRYLGFSDTPAWKVAQAQTMASLRGWAPLCALQIEYSLLERTVEGELLPMAAELGLGVTPWSPLKFGVLSGRYTREHSAKDSASKTDAVRTAWAQPHLNERAFGILDELRRIADARNTTPARVALSWVQHRPGVTSTILGVRTMEQLQDNLEALTLCLTAEESAAMDKRTEPSLNFPAVFIKNVGATVSQGGTRINGVQGAPWPFAPKTDAERH